VNWKSLISGAAGARNGASRRHEGEGTGCAFSHEQEIALSLAKEMALGDKLGNVTGKVVLRRVLLSASGAARTESTQRGTGMLVGVRFQEMTSYESELRADGTLFGAGQGIYMGTEDEMATWTGQGVGTLSKDGGVSFRGAIYLYSTSPKWQRLNAVASVFEYEVDADDNYTGVFTEWK
jgi:hypothetical protein